jgi:hypothetical protein
VLMDGGGSDHCGGTVGEMATEEFLVLAIFVVLENDRPRQQERGEEEAVATSAGQMLGKCGKR